MTFDRLKPLGFPLFACLTLGLAPFYPEPHFFEKIRWLVQGHPFRPIDVFDVFLHGAPWAWLLYSLVTVIRPPRGSTPRGSSSP
jgi:hypothetical protein